MNERRLLLLGMKADKEKQQSDLEIEIAGLAKEISFAIPSFLGVSEMQIDNARVYFSSLCEKHAEWLKLKEELKKISEELNG